MIQFKDPCQGVSGPCPYNMRVTRGKKRCSSCAAEKRNQVAKAWNAAHPDYNKKRHAVEKEQQKKATEQAKEVRDHTGFRGAVKMFDAMLKAEWSH